MTVTPEISEFMRTNGRKGARKQSDAMTPEQRKARSAHAAKTGGAKPIQVTDTREKKQRVVDLKLVEALRRIGATQEEIAAEFGITDRSLRTLISESPELKEVMDTAPLRGKLSLRRKLHTVAFSDHARSIPVLIRLAENQLGMSAKTSNEHSGPDGKPIEIKTENQAEKQLLEEFLSLIESTKQHASGESPDGPSQPIAT